ncbi:hypothetical protein C8R47DRAFT_149742 [Mycena vitilis]|nr:hypothetical protein C8R47DRAFT_149742 [Mycena vitilis]
MELDALEDEDVRIAVRALGQMRNSGGGGGGSKQQPFVFPPSNNTSSGIPHTNTMGGTTPSASASASTSHTPALSLSLASTHPASSPPHTPPLLDDPDAEDDGEDVDAEGMSDDEAIDVDVDAVGSPDSGGHSNSRERGVGREGERGGEAEGGEGTNYPSLARMQSLPLVSGALRVYEAGKASSRVVQVRSCLPSLPSLPFPSSIVHRPSSPPPFLPSHISTPPPS